MGVVTWGGSKVVKSVTGYDVPKLMVGSLGTLGIIAELTLRLHSRPEVEGTWFITLPSMGAAQTLVALCSIPRCSRAGSRCSTSRRCAPASLPAAPAALLVSIGSVAEAVAEQGERLTRLAHDAGGVSRAVKGEWTTSARVEGTRTTLRVGSLPGRLASTHEALARGRERLAGGQLAASGHAGMGVWHVAIEGATPDAIAALVEELRAAVADHEGYVVVTGGPVAVRRRVDPWGPIPDGPLALMRAIKATFDPDGRLNPGRFVSGV
jgi:glycolate oxidase FAD binding subunit